MNKSLEVLTSTEAKEAPLSREELVKNTVIEIVTDRMEYHVRSFSHGDSANLEETHSNDNPEYGDVGLNAVRGVVHSVGTAVMKARNPQGKDDFTNDGIYLKFHPVKNDGEGIDWHVICFTEIEAVELGEISTTVVGSPVS